MTHNVLNQAAKFNHEHRRRMRWYKAFGVMAAIVVFCTTYAMILPAITMERNPSCGLEEHTHTDECYETRLVLACGQDESESHTHDESCYEEQTFEELVLTCTLAEDEEHTHDESCYSLETRTETILVCQEDEGAGHTHDESCYTEAVELVCGLEEHTHTDECYAVEPEDAGEPEDAESEGQEDTGDADAEDAEDPGDAEDSEDPENEDTEDPEDAEDTDGEGPKDAGDAESPEGLEGEDAENPEGAEGEDAENPEGVEGVDAENPEGSEDAEGEDVPESIWVDETYVYEENEFFQIVFHVEGEVQLPQDEIDEDIWDEDGIWDGEAFEDAGEPEETEDAEDADDTSAAEEPELVFVVEALEDGDEAYDAYAGAAEEDSALFVMSYRLTYGEEELDLSSCEITAEVMPSALLMELLMEPIAMFDADGQEVENILELAAYEADEDGTVSELDSVYLYESGIDMDAGIMTLDLDEEEFIEDSNAAPEMDSPVIMQDMPIMTLTLNSSSNTAGIIMSSVANPKFTVEYYAYLNVLATTGNDKLEVIDTSGKSLPKNGSGTNTPTKNPIKYIYLEQTSETMSSGNGNTQYRYNVATNSTLTKVYTEQQYEYVLAPNLTYFNRLAENNHYELKEIWVTKNGIETKYTGNLTDLHFTNKPDTADSGDNFILIEDGTTIRLVYNTTTSNEINKTEFYDYDISNDGKNVNKQGINNNSSNQVFGVGNSDTNGHTGMGENTWTDSSSVVNYLNKANKGTDYISYKGLTFGLVNYLNPNGTIEYSSGVNAPNLFNDGNATGKITHSDSQLTFKRDGDTYTLTAAQVAGGTAITNLDKFNHPAAYAIWTNNFWPLDSKKGIDPLFGADGKTQVNGVTGTSTLPVADDYTNHNCYFGMYYTVDFELSEDYVGPLEYLFYGDDDMWVFLQETDENGNATSNGQLICDIGGVHSSVGEYVNLWDWIEKGSSGNYRLSVFYTERGASGSSCWMQFTLPSVSFAQPERHTGSMTVSKEVNGVETDEYFGFTIQFTDANGTPLKDDYAYTQYDENGNVIKNDVLIWNDGNFQLQAGDYIEIKYLPIGTVYTITELGPVDVTRDEYGNITSYEVKDSNPYLSSAEGEGVKNTAAGGITDSADKPVATGTIGDVNTEYVVTYTNTYQYRLPETGGPGVYWMYALGSALAAAAAATLVYKKLYRKEGRV